jgi:hypothetical protein
LALFSFTHLPAALMPPPLTMQFTPLDILSYGVNADENLNPAHWCAGWMLYPVLHPAISHRHSGVLMV